MTREPKNDKIKFILRLFFMFRGKINFSALPLLCLGEMYPILMSDFVFFISALLFLGEKYLNLMLYSDFHIYHYYELERSI